jgi:phosphoglycerate dehydrogenase-like enzyme
MQIHIENDPKAAGALRLSAGRLRQALATAGLLDEAVHISENADPSATATAIRGAEILFACRKLSLAEAKSAAPALAWVQVISAGVEHLVADLPDGVVLTNASGVHGEKGAEFALAAALMLTYRIPAFASDKSERRWVPSFGGPASGRHVLLLGVGGIGGAAASLLRRQGFVVTGLTRSGRSDAPLDRCIGPHHLEAVLGETEILISTLPLTSETRRLMDRARLERLPEGAGVAVLGRADVFDYDALADLLDEGRLGGAVLDVFPQEPLPADHRLWRTPRLIMTPHCSVDDHAVYMDRCLGIFIENIRRRRDGLPLGNVVDRTRGY